MSLYHTYLEEVENRRKQGLAPKPIDDGALLHEIILQIKDQENPYRDNSLEMLIYNTVPGTTSAAGKKADFLREIITGDVVVTEISPAFAFELLAHMKGGPSVGVLLDLALGDDLALAEPAAAVLKTQVFLYDADTDRLKAAFEAGNEIARDILESFSRAEFFTNLPDIDEEIKVVTYIAAEGDISTDLLSPGNQAHSRSDRELHGRCMISETAQQEIRELQRAASGQTCDAGCRERHHGCWLFAHVRRQQCCAVDRQAGQPLRALRQYFANRRRHERHLTDFPDDCWCHRRHWH